MPLSGPTFGALLAIRGGPKNGAGKWPHLWAPLLLVGAPGSHFFLQLGAAAGMVALPVTVVANLDAIAIP